MPAGTQPPTQSVPPKGDQRTPDERSARIRMTTRAVARAYRTVLLRLEKS